MWLKRSASIHPPSAGQSQTNLPTRRKAFLSCGIFSRRSVTHGTIHGFREKIPHLKNALRRVGKFVCDCPADGGWMDADLFSHIFDHHRLELIDALVQELGLAPYDGFANFDDDVFPLLDVFQQLYG